jgi:Family of unknown function (DUF6524)
VKSHAYVKRKLPFAGVVARFVFVTFWVFATFNPSYYSISTWLLSGFSLLSVRGFVAFSLMMSWVLLLRISLAGLRPIGRAYVGLAVVILALLEAQFGFLRLFSPYMLVLLGELAFAVVLTFGLVFSYLVRQASGQSAVIKRPP